MNIILSMAIRKRISDYFFKRPMIIMYVDDLNVNVV